MWQELLWTLRHLMLYVCGSIRGGKERQKAFAVFLRVSIDLLLVGKSLES
jgi:hypothetical protein